MQSSSIAAVILAAGQASRFGSPQQAAIWQGKSLLGWSVHHATEAACAPIVAVAGAYPAVLRAELPPGVFCVEHPNWELGMLSSLQAGLRALEPSEHWRHCFVLTTDMPWFTAGWLRTYAGAVADSNAQATAPLVATAYERGAGLPLLLPRDLLPTVLALPPDGKLRPLLQNYPGLRTVPSGEHTRDVDRPEDLKPTGHG